MQEPITRSELLPYLLLELSFLQTELFLERLSRQANNAFVYWPTRAPHYFCNKWINYLEGRGNSKNWIVAGLQVGIQSAFRHIGSTANCTLNLPLRKHIFFAGNSKLKISRSVKTISQPKRERCSLLVMGSCRMAILAKTQKWYEGKYKRGGGLQQLPPPPLLSARERVKNI